MLLHLPLPELASGPAAPFTSGHLMCTKAPCPSDAFCPSAPAAGFAPAIRPLTTAFPSDYRRVAIFTALAILVWLGNVASPTSLKRMPAYSSVAGFVTLAQLLNTRGYASMVFYLPIYLFMNPGAFTPRDSVLLTHGNRPD